MKSSLAFLFVAVSGGILGGCQSTTMNVEPAIVFARSETSERSYHLQPLATGRQPVALAMPRFAGNVQTAPRAGVMAANVGAAGSGSAALAVFSPGADRANDRVVVAEWAWDFSLREDGAAIAFIAGREQRRLFVAAAPTWKAVAVALPADATPSAPRWLGAGRLLVVLHRSGGSELGVLTVATSELRTVYRAAAGHVLSDPSPAGENADAIVIESASENSPGRLLRVALAGGEPRVLARGYFLPGSLVVSPDGRFVGAVWSGDADAVRRRVAAFQWAGETWGGVPREVAGVTSAVWSSDGTSLAVARQSEARRWIEVYAADQAGAPPRAIGFAGATCFAPQWWQPRP